MKTNRRKREFSLGGAPVSGSSITNWYAGPRLLLLVFTQHPSKFYLLWVFDDMLLSETMLIIGYLVVYYTPGATMARSRLECRHHSIMRSLFCIIDLLTCFICAFRSLFGGNFGGLGILYPQSLRTSNGLQKNCTSLRLTASFQPSYVLVPHSVRPCSTRLLWKICIIS